MKKLLFVLCALAVQSFIFAYDFKYRVTEDCTGYPEYEHLQKQTVKKGTVFNVDNVYTSTIYLNRYENVFENEYDDNDTPIIAVRDDATDLKILVPRAKPAHIHCDPQSLHIHLNQT